MENTKRGFYFAMMEFVVRVAGMVVSLVETIVKVIDLIDRFRNQKSNRADLPK